MAVVAVAALALEALVAMMSLMALITMMALLTFLSLLAMMSLMAFFALESGAVLVGLAGAVLRALGRGGRLSMMALPGLVPGGLAGPFLPVRWIVAPCHLDHWAGKPTAQAQEDQPHDASFRHKNTSWYWACGQNAWPARGF